MKKTLLIFAILIGSFLLACQEKKERLPQHAEQVREILYTKDSLRTEYLLQQIAQDSLSATKSGERLRNPEKSKP